MKYADKGDFEKVNIFGTGAPNDAYAKYFVGHSFLNPLTKPEKGKPFLANVTFEPGCRNNWHIHHAKNAGGQMLVCVAGEGWYQEEGKDAVSLKPGKVVVIPANVKHWHGAKKDSWFSHIAVEVPGEETATEWCEPVSRDVYDKLPGASETDSTVNSGVQSNDTSSSAKVTAGRDQLGEFAPKFAELNDDVLFGQVWSRTDKLCTRDRCIVTVTSLMSQGLIDSSFKFHLMNAKKNGVTKDEIAEIITHAAFYAGWPKAWAAFRMAQEVWTE